MLSLRKKWFCFINDGRFISCLLRLKTAYVELFVVRPPDGSHFTTPWSYDCFAYSVLGLAATTNKTKKGRTKIVYKFKNKMGPTSFTNLFSYEIEKTNYHLRGISSGLCLLKPHTNNKNK